MKNNPVIIFVYNADSGLFNTVTDIAHKAFSPQTYNCNLCQITHDLLNEKKDWRSYIDSLDADIRFLHKDEFIKEYGQEYKNFPAVYKSDDTGLSLVIKPAAINSISSIEELSGLVNKLLD